MSTADSEATTRGSSQHELIATSREAVQTAEDARAIAVKKLDEAHLNSERQASADAQTAAQAQTDAANAQNAQAQADAAKAQAQTDAANAQSTQAQADAAKAQADLAAGQAASAAAVTAAQADADTANANAQAAQQAAQSATNDKAAMRAQLTQQLNAVLQTRDTARGVIVNMSDVLFDTGKFSLSSGAREKLAKVAGILVSFPGLAIEVGGYTDNVGSDDMNQKLSENRADAVRDYLVKQGVLQISAVGYGNTAPVAANDNATGRQQNRRVELVVSGDAIGNAVTTSSLQ
jgi:outer membrane protein OmpA-like peptidoglycan-associated protein